MATTDARKGQAPPEEPTQPSDERREPAKGPAASFGPYPASSGVIEVSVWRNVVAAKDNGERVLYNLSFKRSYRDANGWKESKTVYGADIPVLTFALGKAYDWLMTHHGRDD